MYDINTLSGGPLVLRSGDLGPPVESVEIQDVDIAEASIGIAASYYIYIISETVHGEAVP